ncbi:MAG: ribokinase [Paenibacillus sp.]|jgi:ribokinase|nr:ribokinase [Paenibacillus sp.]
MGIQARLAIIGSINMDLVVHVQRHPQPGETIHGSDTLYSPGGKGANQAVAGAKSGATVTMIGAIGSDASGRDLLSSLQDYGVGTEAIVSKDGSSGLAFISVDADGENIIILSPGANGKLMPCDLEQAWHAIKGCSAVLLQNEIPLETTLAAISKASEAGIRVYFNPAPAVKLPDEAYEGIYCLILNETEAEYIVGTEFGEGEQAELATVRALVEAGAASVVLTLGSRGAVYGDRSGDIRRVEAYPVHPVDTTAAGDTFIGAFAAEREGGATAERALRFASAAAALAVTKSGAQMSIPTKTDVETFVSSRTIPGS